MVRGSFVRIARQGVVGYFACPYSSRLHSSPFRKATVHTGFLTQVPSRAPSKPPLFLFLVVSSNQKTAPNSFLLVDTRLGRKVRLSFGAGKNGKEEKTENKQITQQKTEDAAGEQRVGAEALALLVQWLESPAAEPEAVRKRRPLGEGAKGRRGEGAKGRSGEAAKATPRQPLWVGKGNVGV